MVIFSTNLSFSSVGLGNFSMSRSTSEICFFIWSRFFLKFSAETKDKNETDQQRKRKIRTDLFFCVSSYGFHLQNYSHRSQTLQSTAQSKLALQQAGWNTCAVFSTSFGTATALPQERGGLTCPCSRAMAASMGLLRCWPPLEGV